MLVKAGYEAAIVSPEALAFNGSELLLNGSMIDLVYNRLVDFTFDQPEHEALRQAYVAGAVAVTLNGEEHVLTAGDGANIPPGTRYSTRIVSGIARWLACSGVKSECSGLSSRRSASAELLKIAKKRK